MPLDQYAGLDFLERRAKNEETLLKNLKDKLPDLEALLKKVNEEWNCEDMVYRYYHHSYKVYGVQALTGKIVEALKNLLPECSPSKMVSSIVDAGTGKQFSYEDNEHWEESTRTMIDAFFHMKFFLEMAIKYAKLTRPPKLLPSGYAALLYFYGIR